MNQLSEEAAKSLLQMKELELNSLLEITQAINSNIPEEALYKIYHFTLIANLHIKKLALYVMDQEWNCKVNFGTKTNYKNCRLPEQLVTISKATELKDEYQDFTEFDIVLPVTHKNTPLAFILIAAGTKELSQTANFSFIQTLTNIIIVAIENKKLARKELQQQALRKELEIAKEVQSFLFPKNLPKTPLLKIDASYYPHDSIGGDYYDYYKIDKDKFIVCIADVSGKGIPAALLMSNFQASLRTLCRHTQDLKSIISVLNEIILDNAKGERFITFFIALVDTANNKLNYINAGHNPPFLIIDGTLQLLDKGTTILGVFKKMPPAQEQEITLGKENFIFAYTDGLTETANEEGVEFGPESLQEEVVVNFKNNELHAYLVNKLNTFKGRNTFPDDITIVSCQITKE